ncbi:uncharacterized protein J7T54_004103 [Emericellopsis cladophorae]|uniref:Uncharacterized protein n=1 Tax=Emericellopsis cladophorae TaxID=2686198 RepID=A0A9P9Y0X3_9HYPO|nr:uncharacterized protein J7T54_004103 [Emericellopsis cladophorae]KAI6781330.1 hypothetical protein J7T54_004103 [Emericellopsis cladophorae]
MPLRPTDTSPQIGTASGTDCSGIIAALGSHVQSDVWRKDKGMRPVKVGAPVFGNIFGNKPLRPRNGVFAGYVAMPNRLIWHMPEVMTFSTAAMLRAALASVRFPLFNYTKPTILVCFRAAWTAAAALSVFKAGRPIITAEQATHLD